MRRAKIVGLERKGHELYFIPSWMMARGFESLGPCGVWTSKSRASSHHHAMPSHGASSSLAYFAGLIDRSCMQRESLVAPWSPELVTWVMGNLQNWERYCPSLLLRRCCARLFRRHHKASTAYVAHVVYYVDSVHKENHMYKC
jgi:hypothetical protein